MIKEDSKYYFKQKTSNEISSLLRQYDWGTFPPKIIDRFLYSKGFVKNQYYRWSEAAFEEVYRNRYTLNQMIQQEKEKQKSKRVLKRKEKTLDPKYSGWNKGISRASQELLDNDNPNTLKFENKASKSNLKERLKTINVLIENLNNEVNLMHGSFKDFDKFDLKYLNSGWGNQAFGYGLYFTTSEECAMEYARGGIIYHADISGNKFLTYDKTPSKRESMSIAKKFFKYYTTEDEYGKEAYQGCEQEFWDYECIYIAQCQDEGSIYGTISSILGSDKEASAFLNKIGYTGLIAHDEQGFDIYVIFNDKDINITKKEKK